MTKAAKTPLGNNLPVPDWVEGTPPAGGTDVLGLRLVPQTIGYQVLNGVTSATPSVRYLALRAWSIMRYAKAELPNSATQLSDYGIRIDAALAYGNVLVTRNIQGVIGSTKAKEAADNEKDEFPLEALTQQPAFTAYKGPTNQVLITQDAESGIPLLDIRRGQKLAEAAEKFLGPTAFAARLAADHTLKQGRRDELTELGKAYPLDRPSEEERAILLDILLPTEPRGAAELGRLGTYGIILGLAESKKRLPKEADFFAVVFSPKPDLPPVLRPCLDAWLRFLARDMIAVVHEGVMVAVTSELRQQTQGRGYAPPDKIIASLLSRRDEMLGALEQAGLGKLEPGVFDRPFGEFRDILLGKLTERSAPPLPRWAGPDERTVIGLGLAAGAGAAAMLPVAWLLAAERLRDDSPTGLGANFTSYKGLARIGLKEVIEPGLARMIKQGDSLLQAIHFLVWRSVDQHLRVAWSRLAHDVDRDIALLDVEAGQWRYRKDFANGQTLSRLPQTIDWMKQLGLIDENGSTEDGRAQAATMATTLARAKT